MKVSYLKSQLTTNDSVEINIQLGQELIHAFIEQFVSQYLKFNDSRHEEDHE